MGEIFDILLSLTTLTILEVVLGIDNLIFLAIISQKLPPHQQLTARRTGLFLALAMRLLLLAGAVWIIKLTTPWISIAGVSVSGRDLFLIIGGMFLIAKATQEIHVEIDPAHSEATQAPTPSSFGWVVVQIGLLDIVFSLDSILTAIGLTSHYGLMATAICIAMICMLFLSEPLSSFVERHPTIKMLALSFLMLIGMVLIADGFHYHIPRGYIYFAMGFSLLIEFLNMLRRKRRIP